MIGLLEFLVADRGLRDDGLDESGAVAHRQKVDLPARAAVVEPSADRDRLALALRDLVDVSNHSSGVVPMSCRRVQAAASAVHHQRLEPRRAATARSSTARGLSAVLHLVHQHSIVADLLERHDRGGPVDAALKRDEMVVALAAVVVNVRRDQVLRRGLNGFGECPRAGARGRRPCRCPGRRRRSCARASRSGRTAVESPLPITSSATFTPTGFGHAVDLLDAADGRLAMVVVRSGIPGRPARRGERRGT